MSSPSCGDSCRIADGRSGAGVPRTSFLVPKYARFATITKTTATMATRSGCSGRRSATPARYRPCLAIARTVRLPERAQGDDAVACSADTTVDAMPGSVSSDLLPGRVLSGRYLLHGAIGTGASGRVYVADDQRLRRRVAVKVLHAALADDAAFLRRFRAEAQLAASLRHANIVTVYDWGQDDVPVHGARAPGGRQPPVDARPGNAAHGRPGRARRARRRVGARVRARPRRAAPRREAGEPVVRRARCRARRRLRSRARARRGELDRTRGRHARNRALRVAGAGDRVCSSTRARICIRWRWCSSSR